MRLFGWPAAMASRVGDAFLAPAASVFRAHRDDHPKLRRHDVQALRAILTYPHHLPAAAGAERALWLDHLLDALQMLRKMAEIAFGTRPLRRARRRWITSRGLRLHLRARALTVQLNEVIERPLDDADRNLPNEAAGQIRPVVEELFGAGTPFTGHHLAKLAKHLGVRNGTETDRRYCVYDQKVKRAFYLRAGIEHILERLRAEPDDCLPAFASRATVQAYEAGGG